MRLAMFGPVKHDQSNIYLCIKLLFSPIVVKTLEKYYCTVYPLSLKDSMAQDECCIFDKLMDVDEEKELFPKRQLLAETAIECRDRIKTRGSQAGG
jgi:hypothetical protein